MTGSWSWAWSIVHFQSVTGLSYLFLFNIFVHESTDFNFISQQRMRVLRILVKMMATVQEPVTHKDLHATVLQNTLVIPVKIK